MLQTYETWAVNMFQATLISTYVIDTVECEPDFQSKCALGSDVPGNEQSCHPFACRNSTAPQQ